MPTGPGHGRQTGACSTTAPRGDVSGKPWDASRRQVWWNVRAKKWVGNDVPDFKSTLIPKTTWVPSSMNPRVLVASFGPLAAFADGPFPEPYEPVESPIANPLHPTAVNQSWAKTFKSDVDKYGTPAEGFNIVCTT